jgi:hypothetical protein
MNTPMGGAFSQRESAEAQVDLRWTGDIIYGAVQRLYARP